MSLTQYFPDNSAEMLTFSENDGKTTSSTSHGNVLGSWLFFDFSLSSQLMYVLNTTLSLAHPASLPSASGVTVVAAGCALKYLQSYQIANVTAVSKYSDRTSHTTLSPHKALHFVKVLLGELQLYSCQVPGASNCEICENMGCVPDRRFCKALI